MSSAPAPRPARCPALCRPGRLRLAVLAAVLAVVTACQTVPRKPIALQSWSARRAELQARHRFELTGRVAVAEGNEGFNAHLRWQQRGAHTNLALYGPFGMGGVRVTSDSGRLSVVTADGKHLSDAAARAELAAKLGFEPPLTSLRYWILGVPDPSQPAVPTLDGQQRLASLEQGGWRIQYSQYMVADGAWLPRRMSLHRGDVRVRLVVDDWTS